ncbi:hypothetical protein [Alicyclobacillus fodiniaquatilis]|jgi:hypothetical protein|uniref:Uncharacterized protein n=1 Tax=Alicyclobacillus fodiniaquatilis TaxID=1661150 RepID=A0ABW4JPH6_9BACL
MVDGPLSPYNGTIIPFITPYQLELEQNSKLAHDQYEVYVNDDFVGHKVLLTQSEEIDDVSAYLHRCDFDDFKTNLDGDHYNIFVEDTELADQIKAQLNAYLSIR